MSDPVLSCACGSVNVEIVDNAPAVCSAFCHCTDCRAITGSPYFWGNGWPMDQVKVSGETISYQEVNNVRHSCAKCGSFMYEPCPGFGLTMLPAARLASPMPSMMHVYVKSKVCQLPEDGLLRFEELPPQG